MKHHIRATEKAGSSLLLMVLVLSTLVVTLLLILFSSQSVDLTMQSKSENLRLASLAAKNSLGLAMARLGEDRDWGKDGDSIRWHDSLSPGAVGQVRFRHNPDSLMSEAPATINVGSQPPGSIESLPEEFFSVNNLGGENSVIGYDGVIVPPNAILVVAVGRYHGTRQVAYQIVLGSPQPYSLASSGPLEVKGETLVAGLDSALQAASLGDKPELDGLQEAGLVSNDGGAEAVKLDGDIQIVGNVEALGGIQKSADVQIINGELKKLNSPKNFPRINFDDWDPQGDPSNPADDKPTLVKRSESVVPGALQNPLYGFQRFSGSVSFPDGLKLDGSAIYVDGDLTLDGPLEGTGALIVRGNVNLRGGAKLEADVMAAVLAEGDIKVASAGGQTSTFQGLLYSQGDLELSNTRTIGTAVAAGSASGVPSNLVIKDSTVISTPDTQDFQLVVKGFPSRQQGGLGGLYQTDKTIGNGWEILEPNPVDLLVKDASGKSVFVWNDSHLKIRIKQSNGSWKVISSPQEAVANGLAMGEFNSLSRAYGDLALEWANQRVKKLNENYKKELVDVVHFDLNEFLKVSSRLKAKKVYFKS